MHLKGFHNNFWGILEWCEKKYDLSFLFVRQSLRKGHIEAKQAIEWEYRRAWKRGHIKFNIDKCDLLVRNRLKERD